MLIEIASLAWLATAQPATVVGLGRPAGTIVVHNEKTGFPPLPDYPEIVSGKIVQYNGAKYLCGRALAPEREHLDLPQTGATKRYLFALETDWQVFEPTQDYETWKEVNKTISQYCDGDGEE